MLKLVRKAGQSVRVGEGTVTYHKKKGKAIELLFDFPKHIRIIRSEIDDSTDTQTFDEQSRVETLEKIRSNVEQLRQYHETPMKIENLLIEQTIRLVTTLIGDRC